MTTCAPTCARSQSALRQRRREIAPMAALRAVVRQVTRALWDEVLPQFAQGGATMAALTAVSIAVRATASRRFR